MYAYLQQKIRENWKSGVTVGLVSIPLAISLAVASNSTPVVGIITAVWAGFVAALFGGSNYNIVGPTGALSGLLMLYSQMYGGESLPMLAILSGIFILVGYFLRFEKYLIFIPGSALHGFILGVALMIMLTQLNAALGLSGLPQHEHLLRNTIESLQHINFLSWPSVIVFLITLVGLLLFGRISSRLPGTIALAPFCIMFGYLCSNRFLPWTVETLGSKFGDIKPLLAQMPHFHMHFSYLVPAFSIAVISIMETMISARIADGLTRTKHNKRKEMLGLSFANAASGLVGGIPATAALARTALNIKSGCTAKISAIISSLSVLVISFFLLPFFKFIPMACIAGILVFVSIRMVEAEHFIRMFRIDKKNFFLSLAVAAITLYEDPIIGLLMGALAAMLLFMERLSKGFHEVKINKKERVIEQEKQQPYETDILVYAVKGSLAYINAQSHIARLEKTPDSYQSVVLDLRNVYLVDLDGIEAFGDMIQVLQDLKKQVFVVGVDPMVERFLVESHIFVELKKQGRVLPSLGDALKQAFAV